MMEEEEKLAAARGNDLRGSEDEDNDLEEYEEENEEEESEEGVPSEESIHSVVTPPKKTISMYGGYEYIVSSNNTYSSLPPSYSSNVSSSQQSPSYSSNLHKNRSSLSCKNTLEDTSYDNYLHDYSDEESRESGATNNPALTTDEVNSHIKGSLSFGLPQKPRMKTVFMTDRQSTDSKKKKIVKRKVELVEREEFRRADVTDEASSLSGGLLVHRPVVPKKKDTVNLDHLSEELQMAYKIVSELMSEYLRNANGVYMEPLDIDPVRNKDYLEVIEKPMWLRKIKENLLGCEYNNIAAVVADIRLMLENAYKFYGPAHSFTKKGLRLEHVLEQKITLLPKELREMCSLENTSGKPVEDIKETHRNKTAKISVNGDNFFSHLLFRVKGCRAAREKDLKRRKMEALKQAKLNKEMEVVQWDEDLMREPHGTLVKSMWELPAIGHFIFLTASCLNITDVSQYELERILIVPQASSSLSMLMSALLSPPIVRQKLGAGELTPMPYNVWARKLSQKCFQWYKCFHREQRDTRKVFELIGIEPQFWLVCGPRNPFDTKLFHEMTLHQRVWLLKALCDFLLSNHKSILDVLDNQPELDLREYVLGTDRNGYQYIHFPQFCGRSFRLYRRQQAQYDPDTMFPVKEESCSEEAAFTVEQVKEFRKRLKNIRRKTLQKEKDADWDLGKKSHTPKVKRRGRPPKNTPNSAKTPTSTPKEMETSRTRPSNLRQRPVKKYTQFVEDEDEEDLAGIVSSDGEGNPLPPLGKKRKMNFTKKRGEGGREGLSDSEEEEEEAKKNNNGNEEQKENGGSAPATPLSRAQQKNPRLRKWGKKKHICDICGKSFSQNSGLNGHLAVHTKEKLKIQSSHENSPAPSSASHEDIQTTNAPTGNARGTASEDTTAAVAQNNDNDQNNDSAEKLKNSATLAEDADSNFNYSNSCHSTDTPIVSDDSKDEAKDLVTAPTDECSNNNVEPPSKKIKLENEGTSTSSSEDSKTVDSPSKTVDTVDNASQEAKFNVNNEASVSSETAVDNCDDSNKKKVVPDSSLSDKLEIKEEKDLLVDNACDSTKTAEIIKTEVKCEVKEEPKDEGGDWDPTPHLPVPGEFELVATSVEELRALVLQFGELPAKPSKAKKKEGEEENQEEEEKEEESENDEEGKEEEPVKRPRCEVLLHKSLSDLLTELQPWETKLVQATKKMRSAFRAEVTEWQKRPTNYVDPAEEAWLSEPEPETVPTPSPAPKTPSPSSSSSEDSYTEDGQRKRKLRKRRVKKPLNLNIEALENGLGGHTAVSAAESVTTSEFHDTETASTFAVSSRGRVRKVKKIINYDQLDFEKLALQAEKETSLVKERRKKQLEDEEKDRLSGADEAKDAKESDDEDTKEEIVENSQKKYVLPSIKSGLNKSSSNNKPLCKIYGSDVKRYILSTSGDVLGYVDYNDVMHSGTPPTSNQNSNSTNSSLPIKNINNGQKTSQVEPIVVVSALNRFQKPVLVRVVGDQALQLMKFMKPNTKFPVSDIKLQHAGKTYVVCSDVEVVTRGIPGVPDSISKLLDDVPEPLASPTNPQPLRPMGPSTNIPSNPNTSPLRPMGPSTNIPSNANTSPLRPMGPSTNIPSNPNTSPLRPMGSSTNIPSNPNTSPLRPMGLSTNIPSQTPNRLSLPNPRPQPPKYSSNITNSVALAYRGLPNQQQLQQQPVTSSSAVSSYAISNNSNYVSNHSSNYVSNLGQAASLHSDTTIVTATPALVPAVAPMTATSSRSSTILTPSNSEAPVGPQRVYCVQQQQDGMTAAVQSPGKQLQFRLSANNQNITNQEGKMVAIPNGKGGYTLSIASDASQIQPGLANIIDQLQQGDANSSQTNTNNGSVMISKPGQQQHLGQQHQQHVVIQQNKPGQQVFQTVTGQQIVLGPGQQLVRLQGGNFGGQKVMQVVQQQPQQQQVIQQQQVLQQQQQQQMVQQQTVSVSRPNVEKQQQSQVVQQVIQGGQVVQQIIGGQVLQSVVPGNANQVFQQRIVSPQKVRYVIQQQQQSQPQQQQYVVLQQSPQQQRQHLQMQVKSPQVEQKQRLPVQLQQVLQSQQVSRHAAVNKQPQQPQIIQQQLISSTQQKQPQQLIVQQQQPMNQQFGSVSSPESVKTQQQRVIVQQQRQPQVIQQQTQVLQQDQQQRVAVQQPQLIQQQQQQTIQQQQQTIQQQQSIQQEGSAKQPIARLVLLQTPQGQKYALQHQDNSITLLSQEQLANILPKGKTLLQPS